MKQYRKTIDENVYVMSDVHNDFDNFKKMLRQIQFSDKDTLFILGDLFDKGRDNPKPVELYFEILKYDNIFCLRGNHDHWLAINLGDHQGEFRRMYSKSYFEFKKRLTEVDQIELVRWIEDMPFQVELELGTERYLLSHAQTAEEEQSDVELHMFGQKDFEDFKAFLNNGVSETISVVGHTHTSSIRTYMEEEQKFPYEVWKNEKGNVFVIDCANGNRSSKADFGQRLACMRLNDRRCYYV